MFCFLTPEKHKYIEYIPFFKDFFKISHVNIKLETAPNYVYKFLKHQTSYIICTDSFDYENKLTGLFIVDIENDFCEFIDFSENSDLIKYYKCGKKKSTLHVSEKFFGELFDVKSAFVIFIDDKDSFCLSKIVN